MSRQCDVVRWDVDPTCNPYSGQYVPHSCEHAVCQEDLRLHQQGHTHWSDWCCPSGRCELERNKAQCELEAGHAGEHIWTELTAPLLSEWVSLPEAAA